MNLNISCSLKRGNAKNVQAFVAFGPLDAVQTNRQRVRDVNPQFGVTVGCCHGSAIQRNQGWVSAFDALPLHLRGQKEITIVERGVHDRSARLPVMQLKEAAASDLFCAVVAVAAGEVVRKAHGSGHLGWIVSAPAIGQLHTLDWFGFEVNSSAFGAAVGWRDRDPVNVWYASGRSNPDSFPIGIRAQEIDQNTTGQHDIRSLVRWHFACFQPVLNMLTNDRATYCCRQFCRTVAELFKGKFDARFVFHVATCCKVVCSIAQTSLHLSSAK